MAESGEIGEGGMSLHTDMVMQEGEPIVVSFQIPGGQFVSLRGEIRSTVKAEKPGIVIHGLAFINVEFGTKRMIRAYVSSRSAQ